jgi:outer membrane lipoprotein-sorting protein
MIGHSFPTLEEKPYIPIMLKNQIIPALGLLALLGSAWALAQETPAGKVAEIPADAAAGAKPAFPVDPAALKSAPQAEELTQAEKFIDGIVKKVQAITSVMADISQQVDMLGQKFQVKGIYRKAPKDRILLRMEIKGLPDGSGVMQQVCDGTTFWDFQQIFETKIIRKLDAGQILAKLRSVDIGDDLRDQIINQMGFAGPEALLIGLRKTVKFDQLEEGTLDGRRVWIVRGNWKSREGLLDPNSQPLPPLAPLPSYIPSLVSIYFSVEDDLWPVRVRLVGQPPSVVMQDTRPKGPDGRRIGPLSSIQKPLQTSIDLYYNNVKRNVPVPDSEFVWEAPPGIPVDDETKRILDGLTQAEIVRTAQKKAEAAKVEEPPLPTTIDVKPPPGLEPAPLAPPPR